MSISYRWYLGIAPLNSVRFIRRDGTYTDEAETFAHLEELRWAYDPQTVEREYWGEDAIR